MNEPEAVKVVLVLPDALGGGIIKMICASPEAAQRNLKFRSGLWVMAYAANVKVGFALNENSPFWRSETDYRGLTMDDLNI